MDRGKTNAKHTGTKFFAWNLGSEFTNINENRNSTSVHSKRINSPLVTIPLLTPTSSSIDSPYHSTKNQSNIPNPTAPNTAPSETLNAPAPPVFPPLGLGLELGSELPLGPVLVPELGADAEGEEIAGFDSAGADAELVSWGEELGKWWRRCWCRSRY
ncbi:hypothetical protein B0H19DRAFT_1271354 [Mycena capillaripes]|nr:hypothetical protein B0H19DRAFT_1271354 [Mycena capillaripes]